MEMADCSSEKTLHFIEEYRKYTILWRSSDKNYKKSVRKKKRSSGARGEILPGFEFDPKQSKKFKIVIFIENTAKC
jgi:hypothetical protein